LAGFGKAEACIFQRKDFYKQAYSILFFSTAFAMQFTPNPNKSMIFRHGFTPVFVSLRQGKQIDTDFTLARASATPFVFLA